MPTNSCRNGIFLFLNVITFYAFSTSVSAEEADLDVLEAVVVTADRREENTLTVPTSVQVINGQTIKDRSYENTAELLRAIPNTNMTELRPGVGESNFSIRGVGTTTINIDQAIGFYVDDIPVTSIAEFGLAYFDVDQVEVLRGPQGTLYGRNSLGGVLHIKTADPKAKEEVELSGTYGNDDEKRFSAIVNLPFASDTLLTRFNFLHTSRDDRINNIAAGASDVDDLNLNAGRGKILYLPNDQLSVLFSADVSDSDQLIATGGFETAETLGVNTPRPSKLKRKNKGASAEVEYLFDSLKLVSLTSYRKHDQNANGSRPEAVNFNPLFPLLTLPFNNDFTSDLDQHTFTQEFRLESDSVEPLKWTVGTFYQYNDADRISDIENVPTGLFERSIATVEDRSFALFADMTYMLTDKFSVTAGARGTWDKKKLNYQHVGSFAPIFGGNFAPNQTLNLDKSFKDFSPRLAFEYAPREDVSLYAKASHGYKSGGFNTEFLGLGVTPYDAESIWSYELGVKGRFLDNKLEVEANVFYMDWDDQQVLIFENGISQVANSKKSESKGFEFQARTKPTDGLLVTASLGYVDAIFKSTPASLGVDGNQQPNTPEWSAALNGRFEKNIFPNVVGFVDAGVTYRSSFYWDVANTLEESGHVFVNLRLGMEADSYEVKVFAKNLFDEDYRVSAIPGAAGFFDAQAQPGNGREVGVTVTLKY